MTDERARIFRGSTELNYSDLIITEEDGVIVNSAIVNIQGTAIVDINSVLDITRADGVTTEFSAKVVERGINDLWKLQLFINGHELVDNYVEQVYSSGTSPEEIVEDVVNNFTSSLTYAGTAVSGITYDENYVAEGYGRDIIRDQLTVLDWQLRIDKNDNVYFEPKGTINNGKNFVSGTNFYVTSWIRDRQSMINKVKVVGGFESFNTTEGSAGTGTEFFLTEKPSGSLRITVSGSVVTPDNYTVDANNKKITFNSSQTAPTFEYSFSAPIVVENQNDTSISTYGTIFKRVPAPFINSFIDARNYSQTILDVYSEPLDRVNGYEPYINWDSKVGEEVLVTDNVRGLSESLIITKKVINASQGITIYELGERAFVLEDWQNEVQDRIKTLERRVVSQNKTTFARLLQKGLKISFNIDVSFQEQSVADSFILGHVTLGRLRTNLNFEADCSNNNNHGTWSGSDINGSQYGTATYSTPRLSYGIFNGTDNYVSYSSVSGTAFCFWVQPDTLDNDIILYDSIAGTARVILDNSGNLIFNDSSNVSSVSVNIGTASWQHIGASFDGSAYSVYKNAVFVGTASTGLLSFDRVSHSNNGLDGNFDELMVFDSSISSSELSDFINKKMDDTYSRYSDLVLWFSFDNPRLGDRALSAQDVV